MELGKANCLVCGTRFQKNRSFQKYCSHACGVDAFYHSENGKAYRKEYHSRPYVKKKLKDYSFEYQRRPEVAKLVQEKRQIDKELGLTKDSLFVRDFLYIYRRNASWQREDPEALVRTFAETACNFSKKDICRLEEKILKKLPTVLSKERNEHNRRIRELKQIKKSLMH